jgi:hypothetical protein
MLIVGKLFMPINKLKNFTKTTKGITGVIILGAIGSILATFLLDINLNNIAVQTISVIRKILLFEVPVWVLLIIALLSSFIIIFRRKRQRPPKWLKFTKMEYKGHIFSWQYNGKEPDEFKELCRQCGCEMEQSICPNCGYQMVTMHLYPLLEKLKKVIRWNIETGEYKKYLEKN